MEDSNQTKFEGYALVEVMGHRRHAGFVTTVFIGTAAFLQVVNEEVPTTQYRLDQDAVVDAEYCYAGSLIESGRERREILIGTGSIYAITPISAEQAERLAPPKHKVLERAPRPLLGEGAPEAEGNVERESNEEPF